MAMGFYETLHLEKIIDGVCINNALDRSFEQPIDLPGVIKFPMMIHFSVPIIYEYFRIRDRLRKQEIKNVSK